MKRKAAAPKRKVAVPKRTAAVPKRKAVVLKREAGPKRKIAAPKRKRAAPVEELLEGTLRAVASRGVETPAAEAVRRREALLADQDRRLRSCIKGAVAGLLDKKGEKVVVLNLEKLSAFSDYFVIGTAGSPRQSQAMADAVEKAMKAEGRRPLSVEGYQSGTWILLDYGDVVFHLFHEEARRFYGLERLWGDAADVSPDFAGS